MPRLAAALAALAAAWRVPPVAAWSHHWPVRPARTRADLRMAPFDPLAVRAVSLDVTGTILTYTESVAKTCAGSIGIVA
eukprot:scaffold125646_cov30-Tisochrysis_lutea.AAC.4